MLSNVSFTGTYGVSNRNNDYQGIFMFQNYIANRQMIGNSGIKDSIVSSLEEDKDGAKRFVTEYKLSQPDYLDKDLETYCKNYNIKLIKYYD